jgi:hypothetical protein
MAHFYSENLPLPLNLFHPRWLIDGPPVLYEKWEMRIDSPYFITSMASPDQRYAGDRFADQGGQNILDAAYNLVQKHKQLGPEDAPAYAEAVDLMARNLTAKQNEKLKARKALPARLPDPQIPHKDLKFLAGRKRALTGIEAAERQQVNEALARRKAQKEAQNRQVAEDQLEQYEGERYDYQPITEAYVS